MRRTSAKNHIKATLTMIMMLAVTLSAATVIANGDGSEDPLSTPERAYDTLKAVIDAQDLDAYKALMSTKLLERMTYEFYYIEGLRSGTEYFEKVPKGEPAITENEASFSETYDEEKVIATYSLVFLKENGRWMFNGYKLSTRNKP